MSTTDEGTLSSNIVGSAEPLTPEQRLERLRQLEAWGVDLSLVRASLVRTPTERVQRMVGLLRVVEELKRGYARATTQKEVGTHEHGT